jgi:hypothetical protein
LQTSNTREEASLRVKKMEEMMSVIGVLAQGSNCPKGLKFKGDLFMAQAP